jgi:hypothetical protein
VAFMAAEPPFRLFCSRGVRESHLTLVGLADPINRPHGLSLGDASGYGRLSCLSPMRQVFSMRS